MAARANDPYPLWRYYPSSVEPPLWVVSVVEAFAVGQETIDSRTHTGVSSDDVLGVLRVHLVAQGFDVESSKKRDGTIRRPVLFGDRGRPVVAYEVDAFHPGHGIVLEVEAGRGAASNADYRDLIRASLMVDAKYLVLAVMLSYTSAGTTIRSYEQVRDRIDAIYASDRLKLPLQGVLLVGY